MKALAGKLVTDVGCGHNFTVCTTTNGDVYAFGSNDEGALGVGDDEGVEESALPLRVTLPDLPSLPSTSSHGATTTSSSDDTARATPLLQSVMMTAVVKAVSCGSFHVVAQTRCGRVLAWGNNEYGQLGLGDEDARFSPELVEMRARVVQVTFFLNGP